MSSNPLKRFGSLLAGALTVAILVGCNGGSGSTGSQGPVGPAGPAGAPGTGTQVNAATLSPAAWIALNPVGTITGVNVSQTQGHPIVTFKLTDGNGNPIVGLENCTKLKPGTDLTSSYPNLTFTIAKYIPPVPSLTTPGSFTAQGKWVNYIVVSTPTVARPTATPQGPGTDTNGTLAPLGNGSYTYTFSNDITQAAGIVSAYGTANPSADMTPLGDVHFDDSKTTRVVIEFFGNARGYGSGSHANTPDGSNGPSTAEIQHPINISYDFLPSTGAVVAPGLNSREIVTKDACKSCHTELAYHGGHRVDTKNCTICHTDQRRYGTVEAIRNDGVGTNPAGNGLTFTGPLDSHHNPITATVSGTAEYDFDQLIHQIHQGANLQMTGHDIGPDTAGSVYTVNFPTSTANCTICHVAGLAAAPQADNWKNVPSRAACGGCHDDAAFLTGGHHPAGVTITDDSLCAGCHTPTNINIYHAPLMNPVENNTAISQRGSQITNNWQATNPNHLPAGAAQISYNIVSATVNALGRPVLQFQILANGSALTLNTWAGVAGSEVLPSPYAAGPNISLTMGVPQDGISPTDFNYGHQDTGAWALRAIWNLTAMAGKLATTMPLASGGVLPVPVSSTVPANTYQITMDGIIVPTDTRLVAFAIGTAGVVQTNLNADPILVGRKGGAPNFAWTASASNALNGVGGVLLPAQTVWAQATGTNPSSSTSPAGVALIQRRQIVDNAKCQACHENLGAFTANNTPEAQFHDNYMNNGEACIFCHTTIGQSTGFSYNAKTWVHALHASGMRSNPYTIQANFPEIIYPGKLNDCEACHVPGSYDFSSEANAAQIPGMLWDSVAAGATYTTGPWVTYNTAYGATASFQAPASPSNAWSTITTQPATYGTSAVSSPITAACAACHDQTDAVQHMTANGGVWYAMRKDVPLLAPNGSPSGVAQVAGSYKLQNREQCLVCHGTGAIADIQAVHMNF